MERGGQQIRVVDDQHGTRCLDQAVFSLESETSLRTHPIPPTPPLSQPSQPTPLPPHPVLFGIQPGIGSFERSKWLSLLQSGMQPSDVLPILLPNRTSVTYVLAQLIRDSCIAEPDHPPSHHSPSRSSSFDYGHDIEASILGDYHQSQNCDGEVCLFPICASAWSQILIHLGLPGSRPCFLHTIHPTAEST